MKRPMTEHENELHRHAERLMRDCAKNGGYTLSEEVVRTQAAKIVAGLPKSVRDGTVDNTSGRRG